GSGMQVSDVNQLVNRFFDARKMMQSFAGGMPGLPGMRKALKQQKPKNKKGSKVSGNPAKRAAAPEVKAPNAADIVDAGAAFGMGPGADTPQTTAELEAAMAKMNAMDLPPQLRQMMDQANKGPRR
ncbi:MAG: signal recognition particle protein, partial [Propionibacteriaceae bacterium]